MRIGLPALGLLLLSLLPVCDHGDESAEIDRLIQLLGSPRFKEREAASKRLQAIGEPALGALREAAKTSQDLEIRHRAARLFRIVSRLNEIAGRYYLGNGAMRFALEVDVDGRFAFAWTGCPDGDEHIKGTAEVENGWLVLIAEGKHIPKGFPGSPARFLPVGWGARTYLLTSDEFLDFCNAINLGKEPRTVPDGLFCLREYDWNESVRGRPAFPREWANYLLENPLQAKVIEMTDERTGRLNVGEKDGVRKGMIFRAARAGLQAYGVRVVSVGKESCLIREENELIVPAIKKGDGVSSQMAPEEKKPNYYCPK